MKMPSKIWVCPDTMNEMGSAVQTEPPAEGYPDHSYVRTDIAEELAQALEAMGNIDESADPFYVEQQAIATLVRFRLIHGATPK